MGCLSLLTWHSWNCIHNYRLPLTKTHTDTHTHACVRTLYFHCIHFGHVRTDQLGHARRHSHSPVRGLAQTFPPFGQIRSHTNTTLLFMELYNDVHTTPNPTKSGWGMQTDSLDLAPLGLVRFGNTSKHLQSFCISSLVTDTGSCEQTPRLQFAAGQAQ